MIYLEDGEKFLFVEGGKRLDLEMFILKTQRNQRTYMCQT